MLRVAAVAAWLVIAVVAAADDPGGVVGTDARLAARPLGMLGVASAQGGVDAVSSLTARERGAPAPCPVDWCQAGVDVPGMERAHARVSRTELVATLLDGAALGPVADLVWMLARTGLELDWRPAQLERASGGNASGRGSVTLWLKLRMDAWGRVSWAGR